MLRLCILCESGVHRQNSKSDGALCVKLTWMEHCIDHQNSVHFPKIPLVTAKTEVECDRESELGSG